MYANEWTLDGYYVGADGKIDLNVAYNKDKDVALDEMMKNALQVQQYESMQ